MCLFICQLLFYLQNDLMRKANGEKLPDRIFIEIFLSNLSLISEQTKEDLESNLILLTVVKICSRMHVSTNINLRETESFSNFAQQDS